MTSLGRYWHTLKYLKPAQLYGRLWFRFHRPAVDARPAPPVRRDLGVWQPPARRRQSMLGPSAFRLLNVEHDLNQSGWDNAAIDRLWRYNLHYFDDLNAVGAQQRQEWHLALLERWVRENPPAAGSGWEPYPASLRIVNWIKWARQGNALPIACVQSMAVQTRWVASRLETHLLGNHLFVNAKALILSGCYFEGPEADGWFARGMEILQRQIPEQILADGGQFELSPMYHALALEDMLDLLNATASLPADTRARWQRQVDDWPAVIVRMRQWLAAMTHPDGEIGFFNDAAIGIAPSPAEIQGYAERIAPATLRPRQMMLHLKPSGYFRVDAQPVVALIDIGPVGPDYLPAHAHADTLSFELSVFGQRVLVNSGTSRYGTDAERQRERGTAAHNTVIVNGENSSEVWGGFRVARRARPFGFNMSLPPFPTVCSSHDGYTRLSGRPVHTRDWKFTETKVVVLDNISGKIVTAEARFHLHPQVRPSIDATSAVTLQLAGGQKITVTAIGGRVRLEPSTWHPEFGVSQPSTCIVVTLLGADLRTEWCWEPA